MKRAGGGGDSDDENERKKQGNKNVRALIDETMKRLESITATELESKIETMKSSVEAIKKGKRLPSDKMKATNISTPAPYESAEIKGYYRDIKYLLEHLQRLQQEEEAKKQTTEERKFPYYSKGVLGKISPETLLQENANIDFEKMKDEYPLKENFNPNFEKNSSKQNQKEGVNINDISLGF